MSEDSKGIIIGAVSVAEVDGFLRAKFGFDTKVRINSNDYAIIQFLDPVRGEHRSLHLFDGQSVGDDRDVYDGPRTLISIGVHGRGATLIHAIVERWGGWFSASDTERDWKPVQPTGDEAAPLPPDALLRIELATALGPKGASVAHALADLAGKDTEKLAEIRTAIDRFLAETNTPDPRP